ncbi:type IVB secretion system protein IcmH/DotU [Pseudomonas sp. CDFA 602]|uniref:type IVB secretion system protein IcmH/DotU n=1 Tax=Pseudomonas californiensis TaxID=2829823 RepID=UPI001E4588B5|nr:type IVB secretion system protein IcmH/DotU [Pseudomonas californiensis]MCD5995495.1 type IVB secretion system protein IcmH/DotU [Pseudomonas californiensis]MCD6001089.1 type IVB secretion system protein IcmH/DotU [Pseudomonas californiensis]
MIHSSSASTGNIYEDLSSLIGPDAALARYTDLDPRFYLRDTRKAPLRANQHNPLVAAASRLLSTLARLEPHGDPTALAKLRVRLGKRISGFAREAIDAGVEHAEVKVASYLLCSLADETVLTRDWGRNSNWATNSLLQDFHDDSLGGEKFFLLLEHFLSAPARYIHQLELIYLCLALGFEGRYAASAERRNQLRQLRHELYQCLKRVRGDACRSVSRVQPATSQIKTRTIIRIPAVPLLGATLLSLCLIYMGFAWNLTQQREAALVPFQSPEPNAHSIGAEPAP